MRRKCILSIIVIIVLTLCFNCVIGCGDTDNPHNISYDISLNRDLLELTAGDEANLTAIVTPDAHVVWTSSNANVAAVDENGHIAAMNAGSAVITATVSGKSAICLVVVNKQITELKLDKTEMILPIGSRGAIQATVSHDENIYWSSSDTAVAAVDECGNITAKKIGATIITASTEEHKTVCLVVVTNPATDITIDSSELEMTVGEIYELDLEVLPKDTTDTIIWGSTNPSVVAVRDGKLYAYSNGEAAITVIVGDICKVCNVKVVSTLTVETLLLNKNIVALEVGEESTLIPTVSPSSAVENIVWGTSDSEVVNVESGKITAISIGTAHIFASVGGLSVMCTVNVAEVNRTFVMPMTVAVGGYEYAVDHTVKYTANDTFGYHFGIDFVGSGDVYAIQYGNVISVETSILGGTVVEIEHSDGLVSIYKSIADVSVQVGDTVYAGDKIGVSATDLMQERDLGVHLHFELKLNGEYIDPASVLPLP